MISKPSINTTCIATLLIGLTFHGWLGTAPVVYADSELSVNSELSGYVYADLDLDYIRDPLEVGIADVEIVLTKLSDSDFSITRLSNQIGYYEFTELDAGVYSITQPTLPLAVRNVCVSVGALRDTATGDPLSSNPGTAMLLDQTQGILPHVEGIELPDRARGTNYNFGQIYFGKAWLLTGPPPITPEGQIPEPSSGLLLTIGTLLLGAVRRRSGRGRSQEIG